MPENILISGASVVPWLCWLLLCFASAFAPPAFSAFDSVHFVTGARVVAVYAACPPYARHFAASASELSA